MRIDSSMPPQQPSGAAPQTTTAIVTPYNAPASGSFQQVMRSVTQSAPATPASPRVSGPSAPAGTTPLPQTLPGGSTASSPETTPGALAVAPGMLSGTASTTASTGSGITLVPPAGPVPAVRPLPFLTQPSTQTGTSIAGTSSPMQAMAEAMNAMAQAMNAMQAALAQENGVAATVGGGTQSPALQAAQQAYAAAISGLSLSNPSALSGAGLAAMQATASMTTLRMPVAGSPPVTQMFGPTSFQAEPSYQGYPHFHTGLDLGVAAGTQVDAAGGGTVISAGWDSTGFGNCIIIDHGNGLRTLYGHLSHIDVTAGQEVSAGQEIGLSGSTGNSSGPHLHFGVQQNGTWVNPTAYLGLSDQQLAANNPSVAALRTTPIGGGGSTPTVAGPNAYSVAGAGGSVSIPALIDQTARQVGIDPALLRAVVQTESSGDPTAVSPSGAKGLMQLLDSTAAMYGVTNPFDPVQNLSGGARYLHDLLVRYHGDKRLAVAAYNAGPATVEQYGDVPPYAETQRYVQKVLDLAGPG